MKKKIIVILVLLFVINLIGLGVREYRKMLLLEAINKNTIIYDSQEAYLMVERDNLQYFKNKKELNEPIVYRDILNRSSIHRAVALKRYEIVKFFIDNNSKSFNFKDVNGMYPIGIAAKGCDKVMIEILKKVSELSLKDDNGKTSADYLKGCNFLSTLKEIKK